MTCALQELGHERICTRACCQKNVVNFSVDKVREIMKIAQAVYLKRTCGGSHLGDFIPDDDITAPADLELHSHFLGRADFGHPYG